MSTASIPSQGLKPSRATEGETPEAKATREKAIRDSYAAAEKALREKHLDEFNGLHKAEAAKRGYDWSPRPTKAEKAEADLRRLLEENPELAEKVTSLVPKG
jgi:hypothetical protein